MVLINVFAWQEQRHRCRDGLGGHREGKRRVGRTERAALTCMHYLRETGG